MRHKDIRYCVNGGALFDTFDSFVRILFQHSGKKVWCVGLVVIVVFSTHFFSRITTSVDSKWSIYTALSLIREGNLDLNEYQPLLEEKGYYAIEDIDGRYYSLFPIGTSLVAAPVVFLIDRFLARGFLIDFQKVIRREIPEGVETFVASIIIALTTGVICFVSSLVVTRFRYALLTTCIFAYCTSAWSVGSRALWQHGPSMCLLSIVLYLLLLLRRYGQHARIVMGIVGVCLAFSYIVRPTNSISIFFLTLVVFVQYRRYFVWYCLGAMTVAIPFLLVNLSIYHFFLSPYYLPQRIGSNAHFFEALAANIVSPARGLFTFSPILLLSLYGIVLKIKRHRMNFFDWTLVLIILAHWGVISSFPHWWGGHSIGPRFFSDMLPYIIYFLASVFATPLPGTMGHKMFFAGIVSCLLAFSFFVHYQGANNLGPSAWNIYPVNVDDDPSRIWDWSDIQFMRNIPPPK